MKLGIFLIVRCQAKYSSIFYSESTTTQIDGQFRTASPSIPIRAKESPKLFLSRPKWHQQVFCFNNSYRCYFHALPPYSLERRVFVSKSRENFFGGSILSHIWTLRQNSPLWVWIAVFLPSPNSAHKSRWGNTLSMMTRRVLMTQWHYNYITMQHNS
jgi:hypothetical protein